MIVKHGSCLAMVNKVEDEDTGEEYLELHNIEARIKGAGDGSIALEGCKKLAKTLGLELRCHPWALNGDHARLKGWYTRHGFVDDGEWFIYRP